MTSARTLAKDVLNNGSLDLLDSMVVERVAYSEKNIYDEQFNGRQRLRRILAEYQQAYPAMHYDVVRPLHRTLCMLSWMLVCCQIPGLFFCLDSFHLVQLIRALSPCLHCSTLQASTTADEYGDHVVASWNAHGSNLGSRMNVPASGEGSLLSGMTMFTFDHQGMITEMVVFRTALAEEAAAISLEWDWSHVGILPYCMLQWLDGSTASPQGRACVDGE
jgi:hypothetical protein